VGKPEMTLRTPTRASTAFVFLAKCRPPDSLNSWQATDSIGSTGHFGHQTTVTEAAGRELSILMRVGKSMDLALY
jgi:hypothetical protein